MYLEFISDIKVSDINSSNKQDCFSLLASHSFNELSLSKIVTEAIRPMIVVCNCFGGWNFGEAQLDILKVDGPSKVSAFQSTAWFPTAAQGQITIQNTLAVPAITFATEYIALVDAFNYAYASIQSKEADVVIIGTVESYFSSVLLESLSLKQSITCVVWMVLYPEGNRAITLRRVPDKSYFPIADRIYNDFFYGVSLRGSTGLSAVISHFCAKDEQIVVQLKDKTCIDFKKSNIIVYHI